MPPNTTPMPSHGLSRTAVIIVTVCSMLSTLMQALDSTIANVALPYMQGSLAASQDQINWVLTSYIVAAAIMTAPTGFLAARFGRSRVFTTSIIGFTLASVLCGMAQTLDQIVVFRVLQGIFGASMVPLSQSIMFDLYPGARRGPAMALWGIGVQVGPVLGPILGGVLTEHYSWRWVFYVNVPFGIVSAAGILLFMKDPPIGTKIRLDWLGFAALSLAVGAFQLMLDRGEQQDWFSSPEIIAEACVAGLALYLFIVQSFLAPKPFLSPKLFTDLNFVIGLMFIFIVGLVMFATLALLAPYLQTLLNFPVITAGLVLAPRGLGTMVAMLFAGRLVNRFGARPLVATGFIASAISLYGMTLWNANVPEQRIVLNGLLQGFAVGFIFTPLSAVMFSTLPQELRTEGTGIFSLMRNLGSAIGISVTGALLESNTQVNHAQIGAAVTGFNRALQTGSASTFWNPNIASGASALNAEITRQASLISYTDNFEMMMVLSLAALPMVLLLRGAGKAAPAATHAAVME